MSWWRGDPLGKLWRFFSQVLAKNSQHKFSNTAAYNRVATDSSNFTVSIYTNQYSVHLSIICHCKALKLPKQNSSSIQKQFCYKPDIFSRKKKNSRERHSEWIGSKRTTSINLWVNWGFELQTIRNGSKGLFSFLLTNHQLSLGG